MARSRVLIVEDERVVALSLRQQLQELGYDVPALAHSGEDAVRVAEEVRPDLILMDVRLEGALDGVGAAALIRQRLQLPVVYLTAYSNQEVLDRAKATEPYGYVLKPYEERELHVVIEMALDKHRLERELRERERWFAATLRSIGDAVITTDAGERVTYLNPVAEQLTGWTAPEGRGRALEHVLRLVNEVTRQPVDSPLRRAIRERTTVPLANHTVLIARDGAERPVDDCASPILGDDGRVVGGVLVFRDVSERRKAEEQLLQSQKLEAVGRLAGGVAHDFNNMMTVVNGFSQLLLGSLPPDDSSRPFVEQIYQAGERAAGLTAQLLAFSRRQIVRFQVIDVNALVEGIQRMLAPLLGEDVRLQTRLAPNLARINADPGQIEQVLVNLAVNARDAMPLGGWLTIETRNVELAEAPPDASGSLPPGSYVALAISDTGSGMSPEIRARVFEPYFTTKATGKGTGLGLAMVHGVVKQAGGHVEVTSEAGVGTTFTIYLPRAE